MKHPLNIVAGENIPYVHEAFESLGNITILPGRAITSTRVQNTNALLIRSITPVNEALLQGSSVEFVGTASAGTNHIDTAYLQSRKIGFASAPGSNANSVAEYIMTTLLLLAQKGRLTLKGKTIGIVGVGKIGKLVKEKAEALGMHPVLNDPPLEETGQINHRSLEETLSCDVVTLHTPLTTDGPYPTFHLLNEHTFKWMKPSTIFINAARGEVVDTHALLDAITHKRIGPTVLDVWEHEPDINWNLFKAVTFGTPHIAGHSLDGKANGTFMIYQALCKHLGREPTWNPVQSLPSSIVPSIKIDSHSLSDEEQIREMVPKVYDLQADYRRMKELLTATPEERPALFDGLRKHYPVRREFNRTKVTLPIHMKKLRQMITKLGFTETNEQS